MTLSLAEFQKQAENKDFKSKQVVLTNYEELLSDLDTAVSLYHKLKANSEDAFLFESVLGGEQIGRYSFIGYRPIKKYITWEKPYSSLEKELSNIDYSQILPFFNAGFIGYFSFESIEELEPSLKLQKSNYPQSYLLLVGSILVMDHVSQKIFIVSNQLIKSPQEIDQAYLQSIEEIQAIKTLINSAPCTLSRLQSQSEAQSSNQLFTSQTGDKEFQDMVKQAQKHIHEGDIFQVVLSHRFQAAIKLDPMQTYRVLRSMNPSPYLFLFNVNLDDEKLSLVGSSPEMIVKVKKENNDFFAEIRPIAGTRARSGNKLQDEQLEQDLLEDPKERSEHVMLIDLARNDLGRIADYGSVEVKQNMIIEKYSHVMHIVSSVQAKITNSSKDSNSNLSSRAGIQALKASFPAGTLSGAPKIEAINIISKLETQARDFYGGAIGYFSLNGEANTAIMIRTLVLKEHETWIQAGAGIVADSVPEKELEETYNKAKVLMKVAENHFEQCN